MAICLAFVDSLQVKLEALYGELLMESNDDAERNF